MNPQQEVVILTPGNWEGSALLITEQLKRHGIRAQFSLASQDIPLNGSSLVLILLPTEDNARIRVVGEAARKANVPIEYANSWNIVDKVVKAIQP